MNRIDEIREQIAQLNERVSEAKERKEELEREERKKEEEIRSLNAEEDEVQSSLNRLRRELAEKEEEVQGFWAQAKRVESERAEVGSQKAVAKYHYESSQREVDSLDIQVKEAEKEAQRCQKIYSRAVDEPVYSLNSEGREARIQRSLEQYEQAQKKLEKVVEQKEKAEEKLFHHRFEHGNLEMKYTQLGYVLEEAMTSFDRAKMEERELRLEIEKTQNKLSALTKKISRVESELYRIRSTDLVRASEKIYQAETLKQRYLPDLERELKQLTAGGLEPPARYGAGFYN